MHSPPPVAQVESLDQYLLQEGETEDEYKRIFELRYSIVLVPFASEADKEKAKQEKEIRALRRSQSRSVEPEESRPTLGSSTTQRLFATPTSMPREQPAGRWSARQMTLTGGSSSRTPTPLEKSSRDNSAVSTLDDTVTTDHNDEDDYDEASHSQLMPGDPLSSYLQKARVKIEDTSVSKRRRSDASTELDDWESFHDALDHPEDNTHQCGDRESTPSTSGLQDLSKSSSSSASSGTKRQHWELSPTNRLMQPREPSTPSKRFAPATSVPVAPRSIVTASLMKPRSFTPSLSFPALPTIPLTLQRRGSVVSDASLALTCNSSSVLWSKSNWRDLEGLYIQMNGSRMDEVGLASIAKRFLDEQESRTGERPPWTNEMVLTRCIALHRVRHGKNSSNSWTRAPHRHLQTSRHSATPYPVRNGHSSLTRASSASPSRMADFVNHQRIERNQRQRDLGQGYQLKSVFKHRLASGLRTVGQLLPFWRDVERGNMDEKEKVAVPLVPAGRAQSVIEAFESQSEDLGWTGSNFSRAGSIVSSPCSDHEGLGATSSCSSVVSIAELIARGHSSRAGSALAEQ